MFNFQISCPGENSVASAIVPLFFSYQIEGAGELPTLKFMFLAEGHSAASALEIFRPNTRGSVDEWLGIHTHLLTNGPNKICVKVLDDLDCVILERTIEILVENIGSLAEAVADSFVRDGVPLFFEPPCDSTLYNYRDTSMLPWFDRPGATEFIDRLIESGTITRGQADQLKCFVENGYLIIPDRISDDLVDRLNSDIDIAIDEGYEGYEYGSSQRIEFLHQKYDSARELWQHPLILQFLDLIFQAEAMACQSLTFVFGSQQDPHQDTVHLTPYPAGYMCGVWTALQDVEPNSGELIVYPKSHRLPRVYMSSVNCSKVTNNDWSEFGGKVVGAWESSMPSSQFEKLVYTPEKGTVLIWHENLLHGGGARLNASLPRRSFVAHYFANGAVAYYDSSGTIGNMSSRYDGKNPD